MEWPAAAKSFFLLFAIVNPIGSIPIFLQLTQGMPGDGRRRAFRTGIVASSVILISFVLVGEKLLTRFFQIALSDLVAAGGLLLLLIAVDHLVFGALVRGVLRSEGQDAHDIGAVPIACPILAGPGAMMTVLVIASEQGAPVAFFSIAAVLGITWGIMLSIDMIYKALGKIVCTVLSKILCLFVAAIGIRLLMQGLAPYLK